MLSMEPAVVPLPRSADRRRLAPAAACRPRSARSGTRKLLVLLAALFLVPVTAQVSKEYDLKAALLYNVIQFTEWPASAFAQADSPLVIGILGRDPFGKGLDDVVRDETYNRRPIVVERHQKVGTARNCHVLFISASESERVPAVLAELKGRPVLTVADLERFVPRGGMVRFYKSPEGKVRLRVNLPAVSAAQLTLSSKLLRVADVVEERED